MPTLNILEKITGERAADALLAREKVPEAVLLRQAEGRIHHSLKARLSASSGPCVIAEVKKGSPSAGLIRPDYHPAELAGMLRNAGAGAISVLTEPRYFMGSELDLREVRRAVELPVLRKDFVSDVYQVYEAAAWGADVVLLIVAALEHERMVSLYEAAVGLGLDVLVEAHTAGEVTSALELNGGIIGVNSRDLKNLTTDLAVARSLARLIPAGRLSVAESGIKTADEVRDLFGRGYAGFLIGEALMTCSDPAGKLHELVVEKNCSNS